MKNRRQFLERKNKLMKKLGVVLMCFVTASCMGFGTTRPSRFYALQVQDSGIEAVSRIKTSVGVEEVKIPEYLDKPQMVTRQENGVNLQISEFNRWSEPLEVMMQQAIASDMSFYLPNAVVKPRVLIREAFNYKVFVEVSRFEGSLGHEAVLDAWWYVFNRSGTQVAREKVFLKAPAGKDYDSLVLAQSRLVSELSRQIALKIAKLK